MTDNEIIKALECCLPQNGKRNCDDCPYAECEKGCADKLTKDSLDLINRQRAEIERLKEPLQKLSEIGYCHNFQLERSDLVSWIYAVCGVIKVANKLTEDRQ